MYLPQFGRLALFVHAFSQITGACYCNYASKSREHRKRDVFVPSNYTKTAITNVRVFDGYKIGEPETVVIDGELIGPPNLEVDITYDAGGRILIPGLMDGHAHPTEEFSLQNLTSYGVTTVFNMACHNYMFCREAKALKGLTSFITAGTPAQGPNSCHANSMHTPDNLLFHGVWEAESAVSYSFGNGSDFYKITAEENGPSTESMIAIVQNCHSQGKQSMAHSSILSAYQQSIAARVDGIQHVPLDGLINDTMAQTILAQNQTVTPTLYIATQAISNPGILSIIGCGSGSTNNPSAFEQSLSFAKQNAAILHRNGVTLIAGTDSVGNAGDFVVPMGSSLHEELQNLVLIGMSPAEALRAATIVPALFHRLPDRGVIEPGKRADLVLLNSDPLVDISNTLDLEKVWVGGLEYPAVAKLS
jgi:imidazolonepropionase-like amidohydrolase